jgi:2Fe-2S ferredoxin
MVQVTYIEHNGSRHTVDVPERLSVMEGALRYRIPGIDGDCGGAAACGTCHVYVSAEWLEKLPPIRELERATLGLVVEPKSNSRLGCQIVLTPELDGLVVEMPASQF